VIHPASPRTERPRTGAFAFLGLLLGLLLVPVGVLRGDLPPAAAVASAHPLASAAGHEVLAAGGNAFDAAVAVGAVLGVVEPYGSGIGGGGFWLLHRAADRYEVMLDARERAPLAAHRDMYLDAHGEVVPRLSIDGPLSGAIPGQAAALAHLAAHYGRLPLAASLAPAIRHARGGFPVDESYRRFAGFRIEALRASPEAARIFLYEGEVPALGHLIRQPELAATLQALAEEGAAGFYAGPLAERLVKGVRAGGGIWSLEDLAQYRVVERAPLRGRYGGLRVTAAAPPSSGGVALLTMLNVLAGYDLGALDVPTRTHLVVEAMRRAYRDRADYLGDPDFVEVPVQRLTAPAYAAGLRAAIRPDRATPSAALPLSGAPAQGAGTHTTHLSVLDREGNRVAATLSINYPFGSGFVAPGTGVLINDEMDDFAAKPGVPNVYGLIGAEANAIAPGKRPLSSMSPTFVEGPHGVAVLGTPGGSRIITMVLLAILEMADGAGPQAWVAKPRYHHQFLPDELQHEPGALAPEQAEALAALGHRLNALERPYGNMQVVWWDRKSRRVEAASDPRGIGRAEVR
jgi:gamma-glutamyltranspeptidase / glutathione hydrolase